MSKMAKKADALLITSAVGGAMYTQGCERSEPNSMLLIQIHVMAIQGQVVPFKVQPLKDKQHR